MDTTQLDKNPLVIQMVLVIQFILSGAIYL